MIQWHYDPMTSPWLWQLALLKDREDMVKLTQQQFEYEIDGIYQPDPLYYAYQLDRAIVEQTHEPGSELIALARSRDTGKLMAYHWAYRNTTPLFSREQTAEARIIHIDQLLPARQRVKITYQAIDQWLRWAKICGVAVFVSSTIRTDQDSFLRIHEHMGFTRRGSIAYIRL